MKMDMDIGIQHGFGKCCMDVDMDIKHGMDLQHGQEHAAWTRTCSMDSDMQHGHRHAPWT
jgi:hypothetical protein